MQIPLVDLVLVKSSPPPTNKKIYEHGIVINRCSVRGPFIRSSSFILEWNGRQMGNDSGFCAWGWYSNDNR